MAFYQAAKAAEIKPIIGVETYVARRSMADREGKADAQPYHLILLAKDWVGYQNLCRIVTDAHLDGYYYKPRIDREYLAKHSEGLVGLSACLNGEVARAIETGDLDEAKRIAGSYRDILGDGNFFFELQDHGLQEQRKLNEQLLRLGPEMGIPLVATNDLHYVRRASRTLTTCCCAWAQRPTSIRRGGCASSPPTSTSRAPPRWPLCSATSPAPSRTRG